MSTVEPVEDQARIFAALGDGTRLLLVMRLCAGPSRSITELTDGLELTRQAVTKHLGVLEKAGVVAGSKVGRERRFSLEPGGLDRAKDYLETVSAQWDDALGRLESFLEDDVHL